MTSSLQRTSPTLLKAMLILGPDTDILILARLVGPPARVAMPSLKSKSLFSTPLLRLLCPLLPSIKDNFACV